MALLAMLQKWAEDRGRTIHSATVDHGLRPEAQAEAELVADWCRDHGIPHAILTVGGIAEAGNLQANARNARYNALATWSEAVGSALGLDGPIRVATAHTLDDQAETVLLRLARGSGAEGLSGMADVLDWKGVSWLRPLLGFRREALRDWLRSEGVPWVEDPSNEDTTFDRIKVRKALELLEPVGITVEGLAATADRLRRQSQVLKQDEISLRRRAIHLGDDPKAVRLDREELRLAVPDTAMRLLAEVLREVGQQEYRPRFRSIEPLYHRLSGAEIFRVTLSKCLIDAMADEVLIRPEHDR